MARQNVSFDDVGPGPTDGPENIDFLSDPIGFTNARNRQQRRLEKAANDNEAAALLQYERNYAAAHAAGATTIGGEALNVGRAPGPCMALLAVLLIVVPSGLALIAFSMKQDLAGPMPSPPHHAREGPTGISHAGMCLQFEPGVPPNQGGLSTKLPEGDYTVFVAFRTTKPGQNIVSWGEGCLKMSLTEQGYFEMDEGSPDSASGGGAFVDPEGSSLTDGRLHSAVVQWYGASGRGEMIIDGFPSKIRNTAGSATRLLEKEISLRRKLLRGEVPGLRVAIDESRPIRKLLGEQKDGEEQCGEMKKIDFDGQIETLRIFDHVLDERQIAEESALPCHFDPTSTTTTTTTTSSSTKTTSETSTTTTTITTSTTTTGPPTTTKTSSTSTRSSTTTTTRTATSTETTTTTMTSSTSTGTTTTITRTSTTTTITRTSTHTASWTPRPVPFFSEAYAGTGLPVFPGAMLPPKDRGMTILTWIKAKHEGTRQEILSWGSDAPVDTGCVSLQLMPEGGVAYGELLAGAFVGDWSWAKASRLKGHDLFDGEWHCVAVSRSSGGVAYLYVDGILEGEGVMEVERPEGFADSGARAENMCQGEKQSDKGATFQGSIRGLRIYEIAMTREQIAMHEAPGGH